MNPNSKEVVEVSMKSVAKLICLLLLLFAVAKLSTLLLLIFLAGMLSVVLHTLCARIEAWGCKRPYSIILVALALFGTFSGLTALLIPAVSSQIVSLINMLPEIRVNLLHSIPDSFGFKPFIVDLISSPSLPDSSIIMGNALSLLTGAAEITAGFLLIWIFSVYLLVDGKRAFQWIADFFPAPIRLKLDTTAHETSIVISAYANAQFITSLFSFLFSLTILSMMHVPGALTLATLAGVFDVVPIAGFFIALLPAAAVSFSISPTVGLTVIVLYVFYHAIESYLITPFIYGIQMKVSGLVILTALLFASTLGGVLFALAVLPIVASYPIIERIWLVKFLGRDVIDRHSNNSREREMPEQVKLWDQPGQDLRRSTTLNNKDLSKHFKRRILIAEDDPDIRATLQDILETEGYHVFIASNGNEALATLERVPGIGLILMDINMPVMDGKTVFETMKRLPQYASIPVVFLSASESITKIEGAAGILKKPSPIGDIIETVEKHFLKNQSGSLF